LYFFVPFYTPHSFISLHTLHIRSYPFIPLVFVHIPHLIYTFIPFFLYTLHIPQYYPYSFIPLIPLIKCTPSYHFIPLHTPLFIYIPLHSFLPLYTLHTPTYSFIPLYTSFSIPHTFFSITYSSYPSYSLMPFYIPHSFIPFHTPRIRSYTFVPFVLFPFFFILFIPLHIRLYPLIPRAHLVYLILLILHSHPYSSHSRLLFIFIHGLYPCHTPHTLHNISKYTYVDKGLHVFPIYKY